MNRILVTGATGNVGKEVVKSLLNLTNNDTIVAGVRNADGDDHSFKWPEDPRLRLQHFDFEDPGTFKPALAQCDILFLLRPPQLSDVKKTFKPLIRVARECQVKHIVFLSVQGVQNSPMIPHYKIEKIIVRSEIPYTFLRPAYFMQNFTTTLLKDLVEKKTIFLPAGDAKFTIIDTADIGLVSAVVLTSPGGHINKSYELTNAEKLNFREMTARISSVLGSQIKYVSPSPLSFFIQKRKEKVPAMFILVMIMLHYFPRFSREPETTECVFQLTGKPPTTFNEFLEIHKHLLI
ncbi:MAG TPA: NmrA family NAD(P)-binding protein [Chitinophagaceae bacterium]|jgi:uncharacterized protein YbjT (DUF2867 family)|nr:NmrA family NAD(P)-binding protein [Chitinophagaceae bacterium]